MKRKHRWTRQAQVNGSRSHGPVTAEGKAISSQNALKSGLSSRKPVILQDENAAAFEELRAGYYHEFQPQGTVESDLVDEMVQSRWQLRRCLAMETALLELERARTLADSQHTYNGLDPVGVLALAFKSLADNSHSLELLRRYHATHGRDFRRALDTLWKLRAQAEAAPPASTGPQTRLEATSQTPETEELQKNDETNQGSPFQAPENRPSEPGVDVPEPDAGADGTNRTACRLIPFPTPPGSPAEPDFARENDLEKEPS